MHIFLRMEKVLLVSIAFGWYLSFLRASVHGQSEIQGTSCRHANGGFGSEEGDEAMYDSEASSGAATDVNVSGSEPGFFLISKAHTNSFCMHDCCRMGWTGFWSCRTRNEPN